MLLPDGTPVHTYYAASTFDGAVMESVLHDVPLAPAGHFNVDDLDRYRIAKLRFHGPIECVSFHTPYLPQLGLARAQLIDSLPAYYGQTRKWAQAAFDQRSEAKAIAYGSRRHDAARCIMLFGQRLTTPLPFTIVADMSLAEPPSRTKVLSLVARLGIATS